MPVIRRSLWVPLLLLTLVACDRTVPARSNDTVQPVEPLPPDSDTTATVGEPAWESELGNAVLVVGATPEDALVVLSAFDEAHPLDSGVVDIRAQRRARFALFGSGQLLGTARLGSEVKADLPAECTSWPLVRLDPLPDTTTRNWSIGFREGAVEAVTIDSLPGLASADSSRLTRELARAASAAPGDTVAALRGIPYQVRRAYRFTPRAGMTEILAEVVRTLNQEASPTHEHMLLVATVDSASGRLTVEYSERDAGTEEAMESAELLFAGRIAGRDIGLLMIVRYVADGVIFSLLESPARGNWYLRWSSSYAGC
jgi:hypothetical protein